MSRRPQSAPVPRFLIAAATVLLLVGSSLTAVAADTTEALTLPQDGTTTLDFHNMKRVWVTQPDIIDVVVVSFNQLLVYSKAVGRTKLYVWDANGRHEYSVLVRRLPAAEQVARELTTVLGRGLTYTVVDDATVLVEGEVGSQTEKERVTKVIEAKSGGVKVVDLVSVRDARLTPAEEHRRAFAKLFPDQFRYSVVDERTLVIEGEVATAAERLRMDKILAAATAITVVDLVSCREDVLTAEEQRIETLKQAIGDAYEYTVLGGSVLIISGEVQTAAEKERIDKICAAVGAGVTVANVVTVKSDPRPAAIRYAETLREVLGPRYTITPLGDAAVVMEGVAPSTAEEEKARKLAELVGDDVRVLNLVSVHRRTPAENAVAMLTDALGAGFRARAVSDDVAVLEGTATSPADKDRVQKLVAAAPREATIVDLVDYGDATRGSEAARWEQVLRPVLGEGLTYRVLDAKTLLVEGELETAGDKDRADKVLEALATAGTVINLVTVKPGPGAMARSPAAKKAEALSKVLGEKYLCAPVDERTVLVQGVTPGEAEQQRLTAILEQLKGDVVIVNALLPAADAATKTPAQRMAEALMPVVPTGVKVIAVDAQSVLLEGIVPTTIEKEGAGKLAEMASKSGGVTVLSLVMTESESKTPAVRRIEGLKKILGDKYNYIIWDDQTVLVDGEVGSEQELERVKTILQAANEDWKVGNLVTYGAGKGDSSAAPPVEQIASVIGEPYRVWQLKGRKVVVEGVAPDAAAMSRLTQLLTAFQGEADILNLVTVAPEPSIPLVARAEALRTVLGENYQVKTLQGKTIIVEAVVPSKQEADRAKAIIRAMSEGISVVELIRTADPAKRQVVVHVKVLDLNSGASKRLGPNFGQVVAGSQQGTVTFGDQPVLISLERGLGSISDIAANIEALRQEDKARILAEPNLLVNEGEEGEIVVGGEVPIPVPQLGTGAAAIGIEYKQYGVILKIKPTIAADGKTISLELSPEVSSVDTATQVSIGGVAVPAFRSRKAKTTVDMPDGSTLIIGGLIQNDQSKVVSGIPLLSKIPIIGNLFRSVQWRRGQAELVITVTPEILQTKKP